MKAWWTPAELAEARLPGLPVSERGVQKLAARSGWHDHPTACRQRSGRGGGREHHYSLLPEAAIAELARREASAAASLPAVRGVDGARATKTENLPAGSTGAALPSTGCATSPIALSPRAQARGDARLVILAALDAFVAAQRGRMTKDQAVHAFAGLWSAGQITAEPWVREAKPTVSRAGLWNWLNARERGDLAALVGRYRRPRESEMAAVTAAVREFTLGTWSARPHLSAAQVRELAAARFCPGEPLGQEQVRGTDGTGAAFAVPLPLARTFRRWLADWREANPSLTLNITNPGQFNNYRRVAIGDDIGHVTALNQLWLIDASPQDVLTVEGRMSIYLLIDVWSRRLLVLVTRTPRTEAVKLLLRRGLIEWGVPAALKTDNGSDFVSREALRVFGALSIERVPSTPYCPWEKGCVERHIGTLQHSFFPHLPGYCGHSVAAAQALRERKVFAERLGESDRAAFAVELTGEQVQRLVDVWCAETYAHRPHGGTGMNGQSPAQRAASWSGPVRQVPDVRALDLLLMRVEGTRVAGKKGIRFGKRQYWVKDHCLATLDNPKEPLEIRVDPADPSQLYVWRQAPPEFLGVAVCLDSLPQAERAALAGEAVAVQRKHFAAKRTELRQLEGQRDPLTGVMEVLGSSFERNRSGTKVVALVAPAPEALPHRTPALEAAGRAAAVERQGPTARALTATERTALDTAAADLAAPPPPPDTARDRFHRAIGLEQQLAAGMTVTEFEQRWLASYRTSAEYLGHRALYDDFGEAMFA